MCIELHLVRRTISQIFLMGVFIKRFHCIVHVARSPVFCQIDIPAQIEIALLQWADFNERCPQNCGQEDLLDVRFPTYLGLVECTPVTFCSCARHVYSAEYGICTWFSALRNLIMKRLSILLFTVKTTQLSSYLNWAHAMDVKTLDKWRQ